MQSFTRCRCIGSDADSHASDSMRACIGFDAARVNRKSDRPRMLWVRLESKVILLEVLPFLNFSASGCVRGILFGIIIVLGARDILMEFGADAVLGQTAMQYARE